jgi:hypothetical protein
MKRRLDEYRPLIVVTLRPEPHIDPTLPLRAGRAAGPPPARPRSSRPAARVMQRPRPKIVNRPILDHLAPQRFRIIR